jgi:hypothetical protein
LTPFCFTMCRLGPKTGPHSTDPDTTIIPFGQASVQAIKIDFGDFRSSVCLFWTEIPIKKPDSGCPDGIELLESLPVQKF